MALTGDIENFSIIFLKYLNSHNILPLQRYRFENLFLFLPLNRRKGTHKYKVLWVRETWVQILTVPLYGVAANLTVLWYLPKLVGAYLNWKVFLFVFSLAYVCTVSCFIYSLGRGRCVCVCVFLLTWSSFLTYTCWVLCSILLAHSACLQSSLCLPVHCIVNSSFPTFPVP